MNILKAIEDTNLFRPFLGELRTWAGWLTALRALYGLSIRSTGPRRLLRECTGRDPSKLPRSGFDTALFLTGRRSGKSRMAAVVGAYEAVLAGHESKLAKGEKGVVAVCAPTRTQGRIVRDYIRAIFETPMLAAEVANETKEGFDLNSGTRIEILTGDFRSVRGFTLLAVIVDEAAFFGFDAESKVRSDTELIRALKPSLATVGGKLIAISTPYAQRGWCFQQHKRYFGNDSGRVLVWNCPSRTMNPTLPQSVVDEALAEDLAAAKAEYLGEFRDDVASFLPREVVEALVISGRRELPPQRSTEYTAFVDLSGGRGDAAALAIAHKVGERTVVIDKVENYSPPFNPYEVCVKMAETLGRYGLDRVTGDNYSAEFVAQAFRACGISYERSPKPKSQLYLELLPRLCSGEIELLDDPLLVNQIAGLERRTRSGGRDSVDHGPNGHDDLANVVAGVTNDASISKIVVGVLPGGDDDWQAELLESRLMWEEAIRRQYSPRGVDF